MNAFNIDKFKLQFITNESDEIRCLDLVRKVLDGGCKWVQFRYKTENIEDDYNKIVRIASNLKEECHKNNAIFIIDDYVDICKELKADGVHLGKNDLPISQAREILGDDYIIGGTANTLYDITNIYNQKANYIGLGPFRFTTTKKKLENILGLDGYRNILSELKRLKIIIPIVSIGGIKEEDIFDIMNVGIDGIAISGEISNASNPSKKTNDILLKINNYIIKQ
ncbi:MAG: thiamine phosphate synthase [Bacteroidetes bacterium]|nr:thiamine phosphate synthase [Bacteroidota bacterium]